MMRATGTNTLEATNRSRPGADRSLIAFPRRESADRAYPLIVGVVIVGYIGEQLPCPLEVVTSP